MTEDLHGDEREPESCGDAGDDSDDDLHVQAPRSVGLPQPASGPQRGSPKVAQFDGAPPCARARSAGPISA